MVRFTSCPVLSLCSEAALPRFVHETVEELGEAFDVEEVEADGGLRSYLFPDEFFPAVLEALRVEGRL